MPNLGTTEIIIIAIVILVLFGSAKLPKAAKSLGQSMRIFKAETKGLRGEDDDHDLQGRASAERPVERSALPPVTPTTPVAPPPAAAPEVGAPEARPEQR